MKKNPITSEDVKAAYDYASGIKPSDVDRLTVMKAYLAGHKRASLTSSVPEPVEKDYLSVRKDDNGEAIGIRVTALGEDFTVALKDCEKEMDWHEACKHNAPTKKQALIMSAIAGELSDMLDANGGQRIDDGKWRWTCDEYNGSTAWLYSGTCGTLGNNKYNSNTVRPTLAYVSPFE
jgi:hypothetical protein